jgi:hypothetical protein
MGLNGYRQLDKARYFAYFSRVARTIRENMEILLEKQLNLKHLSSN